MLRPAGGPPADQLFGISTVSMRYTVALRVWTLPHTTRASLAVYVSPDFAVRIVPPCSVVRVPESRSVGPWRCLTTCLTDDLVQLARIAPTALAGSGATPVLADAVGARLLTDDPVTAAEQMPTPGIHPRAGQR
jgi:hypothetical protein